MENLEERSKIERLKNSLYSRITPSIMRLRRSRVRPHEIEVKNNWAEDSKDFEQMNPDAEFRKKKKFSFFKVFFLFSLLFFIAAGGYALYMFINGGNLISARNLDIQIIGPVNVNGGEAMTFDVEVNNKNPIKIEVVDTQIEFPSGTADPADPSKELQRAKKMLGDIEAGQTSKTTFGAIFFGSQGDKKEVVVKVSYHVANSNATLEKEKTYELYIQSSPVNLIIKSNDEVVSGENLSMQIDVVSNSDDVLKNILLKAEYPFGFTFTESSIKPYAGNNVWFLGDIPPKSKRSITVNGKMIGQDDEIRAFRFFVGSRSTRNDSEIGTSFLNNEKQITIKKPFFSTRLVFDGNETNKFIAVPGRPVNVSIFYKNNLDIPIVNNQIKVKLSGNALNSNGVNPGLEGLYRAGEKAIYWDKIDSKSLEIIEPGEEDKISFSITPSESSGSLSDLLKNPQVNIEVSVKGERTSESNVPTSINSSAFGSILLAPRAYITAQLYRDDGYFDNSGHIPPKADTKTTYTVVWTLNTTSSSIDNVKIEADIPSYVDWLAVMRPDNEDVSYDQNNKHIVWKAGKVNAYTGKNQRQFSFQIAFTPSLSQVGSSAILLRNISLTGRDEFTGLNLEAGANDHTTKFVDKDFKDGDEKIIE